jgi:ABC-type multidrug transport system ATPase subunit
VRSSFWQLRLFCAIKGVPSSMVDGEVESLIADLDLSRFAHKPSRTYSGGNKRKLCVGIALVGKPSLVLLDEPSSAMDAASKRFLWSVIKRRTAHASAMLTTHSMEECEALCSRICVMVDGCMRTLGPIQALKTRYGRGLKVDVRLAPDVLPATFVGALQAAAVTDSECVIEENEPPLLTVVLPEATCGALGPLFNFLNDAQEGKQLLEFSVSQTTLEQVFLQLARRRQEQTRSVRSSESGSAPNLSNLSEASEASPTAYRAHHSPGSSPE